MSDKIAPEQSVRQFIRIFLKPIDGKTEMEHFDYNRSDKVRTNIDAGFEDLDMRVDVAKIMLYMQNDIICFNNSKRYKVIKREFQPCVPVTLVLYVEEFSD